MMRMTFFSIHRRLKWSQRERMSVTLVQMTQGREDPDAHTDDRASAEQWYLLNTKNTILTEGEADEGEIKHSSPNSGKQIHNGACKTQSPKKQADVQNPLERGWNKYTQCTMTNWQRQRRAHRLHLMSVCIKYIETWWGRASIRGQKGGSFQNNKKNVLSL